MNNIISNVVNEDKKNTLKCRKCGGAHLTIKCGKIIENNNNNNYNNIKTINNIYKVKISNLPNNIEYNEISYFIKEWGHIGKIIVKNYDDTSIVIIEFKFEEERNYFIRAMNLTPFDHFIIKVEKID